MSAARTIVLAAGLACAVAGCGGASSSGVTRSQFGGTVPGAEPRTAPSSSGPRAPRQPATDPDSLLRSQFGGTSAGATSP